MNESEQIARILGRMKIFDGGGKGVVRDALLSQKYYTLKANYSRLKRIQPAAMRLIRGTDYKNLKPRLVFVPRKKYELWTYYRMMFHSAPWTGRPGRVMSLFCIDQNSGNVLGVMDIGSDLHSLRLRDRLIGWNQHVKYKIGNLKFIINVGSCVSIEPFGKLIGGKFQIMAVTSDFVLHGWRQRYRETPAAFSTTSLYGKSSIYNRLKEWPYLGCTQGITAVFMTQKERKFIADYLLKKKVPIRSNVLGRTYGTRHDVFMAAVRTFKIKNGDLPKQPRGVYFYQTASNSLAFLRGNDTELVNVKSHSQEDIRRDWHDRWYVNRLEKKKEEIDLFDPTIYTVNRQLEIGEDAISRLKEFERMRAESIGSDVSVSQTEEAGANPCSALTAQ